MVFLVATEYNQECWKLYIVTVFLNAAVVKNVYVEMRPGFQQLERQAGVDVAISYENYQGRRRATLSPFSVEP